MNSNSISNRSPYAYADLFAAAGDVSAPSSSAALPNAAVGALRNDDAPGGLSLASAIKRASGGMSAGMSAGSAGKQKPAVRVTTSKLPSAAPSSSGDTGHSQIAGFFQGVVDGATDMGEGVWNLAKGAAELSPSSYALEKASTLTGIGNYRGFTNASHAASQTLHTVVTQPRAVLQAAAEPYKKAWSAGEYGKAIGRGTFDAATLVLGGAAGGAADAGKAAEAATFAERAGAKVSMEASTVARTGIEAEPLAQGAAKTMPVVPNNPRAYSVAYEMKLEPRDFGKSRSVHFNRANASLDNALQSDPDFAGMMENLIPGVQDSVSPVGRRAVPNGWTWDHASRSTAFGQDGVMRLVPSEQHTPGSPWWRVLHPDEGASGGYSEWAIPNGAPKN